MGKGSDAAREMARQRWAGTTAKERSEEMSAMAKNRWSDMTEEERSAEMRRRRLKGLKKKPRAGK